MGNAHENKLLSRNVGSVFHTDDPHLWRSLLVVLQPGGHHRDALRVHTEPPDGAVQTDAVAHSGGGHHGSVFLLGHQPPAALARHTHR